MNRRRTREPARDPWRFYPPKKFTRGLKRQVARVERQNRSEADRQRSILLGL